MKLQMIACSNCLWWRPNVKQSARYHPEDFYGECRRYPPKLNLLAQKDHYEELVGDDDDDYDIFVASQNTIASFNFYFPKTSGGDYCGEWKQDDPAVRGEFSTEEDAEAMKKLEAAKVWKREYVPEPTTIE